MARNSATVSLKIDADDKPARDRLRRFAGGIKGDARPAAAALGGVFKEAEREQSASLGRMERAQRAHFSRVSSFRTGDAADAERHARRLVSLEKDVQAAQEETRRKASRPWQRPSAPAPMPGPGYRRGRGGLGVAGDALTAAAGIGAGVALAERAIGYLDKVTMAASDMNEAVSRSRQVFRGQSADVEAWAQTAAESFGASTTEAVAFASTLGVQLNAARQEIDATGGSISAMSKELVQRAGDLASFGNVAGGTSAALDKLQAGLAGETEPLRSLGVYLSAARVEAEAFASGIARPTKDAAKIAQAHKTVEIAAVNVARALKQHGEGSVEATRAQLALDKANGALEKALEGSHGELTEGQKILARYQILLKDSALAAGDFGRTSEEAANQNRQLAAEVANLEEKIGRQLLPHRKNLYAFFLEAADGASVAVEAVQNFVRSMDEAHGVVDGQREFGQGSIFHIWGDEAKAALEYLQMLNREFKEARSAEAGLSQLYSDLGAVRTARATLRTNQRTGQKNPVYTPDVRDTLRRYGVDTGSTPYVQFAQFGRVPATFEADLRRVEIAAQAALDAARVFSLPTAAAGKRPGGAGPAAGGAGAGGGRTGAPVVPLPQDPRKLADSIKTPLGEHSCGYFASEFLQKQGKRVPTIGSARGLEQWAKANGATIVPASQARPGDLIGRPGNGPSGRHVGVFIGDGMMVDSSGKPTVSDRQKHRFKPFKAGRGDVVYRLDDTTTDRGAGASYGGAGGGTGLYSGADRAAERRDRDRAEKKRQDDLRREAKRREAQQAKLEKELAGVGIVAARNDFAEMLRRLGRVTDHGDLVRTAQGARNFSADVYLRQIGASDRLLTGDVAGQALAREKAGGELQRRREQVQDAIDAARARLARADEQRADIAEQARDAERQRYENGLRALDAKLREEEEGARAAFEDARRRGDLEEMGRQRDVLRNNLALAMEARNSARVLEALGEGAETGTPGVGTLADSLGGIRAALAARENDQRAVREALRDLEGQIGEVRHNRILGRRGEPGKENNFATATNRGGYVGLRDDLRDTGRDLTGQAGDAARRAATDALMGRRQDIRVLGQDLAQGFADTAASALTRRLVDRPLESFFERQADKLAQGLMAGGRIAGNDILSAAGALSNAAGILSSGSGRKKRGGLFGSILGGIVGSLVPGVGWLAGLSIGGALGSGNVMGAALGLAGTGVFGGGFGGGSNTSTSRRGSTRKGYALGGWPTPGRSALFGEEGMELSFSRFGVSALSAGVRTPKSREYVLPAAQSRAILAAATGGGGADGAAMPAQVNNFYGDIRSRQDAIEVAAEINRRTWRRARAH